MFSHSGSSQKVFLEVFLTPDHESIDIILLHFCFLALDSCLNHSHLLLFCHCQQCHSDDLSGFQFYWALFLPFLQKLLISSSWICSQWAWPVKAGCLGALISVPLIFCALGSVESTKNQKDIIPEPIKPGGVHPKLGRQVDSQRESAVHGVVKKSPTEREEKLFSSRRHYLTTLSMNAICANF